MSSEELERLKVEFSERARPLIFWTGAGVSPLLPGWTALRDELIRSRRASAMGLKADDKQSALRELAQIEAASDLWIQFDRLKKTLGPEPYERVIKESLIASEKAEVPLVQTRIWELSPNGVVTLNLDLFTQRAAASYPAPTDPVRIFPGKFGDALNVFRERRPFIAYPHGNLDNPSLWTFTKSELDIRLKDSHYIEWLTILFRTATVVFVGVTADDIAIGSPLERIASDGRVGLTGHYWITARDDGVSLDWSSQHGVRIVRYDNKSKDHSGLIRVLEDLKGTVRAEDPLKELPVFPRNLVPETILPPQADMLALPEEEVRRLLNARAKSLLTGPGGNLEATEYKDFLARYAKVIHKAWYASIDPGESQFLGYTLVEEAPDGAFGVVFKGYGDDGNPVAVKILKDTNFKKQGFHRSFRRGANSLRILTERKIPGVIEFVDAAEIPPTIVMAWSDGMNLKSLVQAKKTRSWQARVKLAFDLARVIRICHGLPERVLHRDLRPANVMVEETHDDISRWKIKVLDFDLSWHKGAEDHSIMHSPAFGYLAPEQRTKGPYTTRSGLVDSYGLGMTLYFLISEVDPFPDQHQIPEWAKSVAIKAELTPCREWVCLPRRFARLIEFATLHEQLQRWSATQIEGELESLEKALSTGDQIPLVDVITEELAARTEHFRGYTWSEAESAAILDLANGVKLRLQTSPEGRSIHFSTSWANSGAQDWNHIDRMLQQAVPKLETALREIGDGVKVTKSKHAFTVIATFDADSIRSDPARYADTLDKAVGHASSIADF